MTEAPTNTGRAGELPATMRAAIQRAYGSADQIRLGRIERPTPGREEVLVRVECAGVDRGTWHLMTGLPYLGRLVFGLRRPREPVPGLDLTGTVVALGSGVTRFRIGDRVLGIGKGAMAEYARAPEDKLVLRPPGLDAERAAVTAVSGLTALQAVRDVGRVEPGQRVLVIGASGGVGTFAVQIAHALGADVTGVASAAKADLVAQLGATRVIDYASEDFADGSSTYDLIIDIGGNSALRRLRRALTPKGTLVIVGGEGGGRLIGGVDRQLRAMVLSVFSARRLTTFISKEDQGLDELVSMVEAGTVTPHLDRTFALNDAAGALRYLESGRAAGKVAVRVADTD